MTQSTDTKNITKIVKSILSDNGIDCLKAEIDLVGAWMRYMREREVGETPAQARERIAKEFNFGDNEITTARARMMQLIMDTIGVDVDENNASWSAVISFCIEREKAGESVQAFREWMNNDPYNSPKKHQIAQHPTLIKSTWRSAFEKKTDETRPEYIIPERVRMPRPENVPPPNLGGRNDSENS